MIPLHSKCSKRLIEEVANVLDKVTVDYNIHINYQSIEPINALDKTLPSSGEVREALNEYIGENPLAIFIINELCDELDNKFKFEEDKRSIRLSHYPGYENLNTVSERLISKFIGLPCSYVVNFAMPDSFGLPIGKTVPSFNFNNSIKIFVPDNDFIQKFPLPNNIGFGKTSVINALLKIHALASTTWNPDTSFLNISVNGYIDKFYGTKTLEKVNKYIRSFFGLAIGIGLLEHSYKHASEKQKQYFVVHIDSDGKYEPIKSQALPDDVSNTLMCLKLPGHIENLDDDNLREYLLKKMSLLSIAYISSEDKQNILNMKSKSILLASEWLLNSYSSYNELLSFVQATVVMEILLGDTSKTEGIGIKELLKNRCAYLVGKSHKQRNSIMKVFDKIYSTRSKIVHTGQDTLTNNEQASLLFLKSLCCRVIQEEINLLNNDAKRMHLIN